MYIPREMLQPIIEMLRNEEIEDYYNNNNFISCNVQVMMNQINEIDKRFSNVQ